MKKTYITPTSETYTILSSPLDDLMGNPVEHLDEILHIRERD